MPRSDALTGSSFAFLSGVTLCCEARRSQCSGGLFRKRERFSGVGLLRVLARPALTLAGLRSAAATSNT